MNNSPTNTTRQMQDSGQALGFLLSGGDILAQEKQGQTEMVHSDVIPSKGTENIHDSYWEGNTRIQKDKTKREEFEALGFVFGELVEGDEMFTKVTLPEGWSRQGSTHAMWSHIVDERGIPRVSIFYKAAFYDRDAFCDILNVGRETASKFIWSLPEDPDYLDAKTEWFPKLTEDELEDAIAELERVADEEEESWWNPERRERRDKAASFLAELKK